jgi:hypothetical protein
MSLPEPQLDKELATLARLFPNSFQTFEPTSPSTYTYNCIAWAAGDDTRWWWPDVDSYWPDTGMKGKSPRHLCRAFETLGYESCDMDATFDPNYDKVALFELDGRMTHAARQLGEDAWTSKAGNFTDFTHPLHALDGTDYGAVFLIMRRAR